MRVVPVGTAQGARVRPQDRAHHPPVRGFQDVRAVHLLRRAVIPTEDADLGLLLIARHRFPHLPLHAEQIKSCKAPSDAHLPLMGGGQQPSRALVLEGAQAGEALLQIQDGDGGGRGAAAGVQVSSAVAVAAGRDNARARGDVVQAQSSFQGLRDGVGILGDAVLVVLCDQRGEAEIVIPKIEGVIVGGACAQVVVVQKIHVFFAQPRRFSRRKTNKRELRIFRQVAFYLLSGVVNVLKSGAFLGYVRLKNMHLVIRLQERQEEGGALFQTKFLSRRSTACFLPARPATVHCSGMTPGTAFDGKHTKKSSIARDYALFISHIVLLFLTSKGQ